MTTPQLKFYEPCHVIFGALLKELRTMVDDEFTAVRARRRILDASVKIISSLKLECYTTRKMVLTRHRSGIFACDQTMKKGGYLSHAIQSGIEGIYVSTL